MNQAAAVAGPMAVPQPTTPSEQYLYSRINSLENVVATMANHDIRSMSPGRMALVVGGSVVVVAGISLATTAIYDRAKNGRTNQQKVLK